MRLCLALSLAVSLRGQHTRIMSRDRRRACVNSATSRGYNVLPVMEIEAPFHLDDLWTYPADFFPRAPAPIRKCGA